MRVGFGVWRWRWTLDVGENRQSTIKNRECWYNSDFENRNRLYEFILQVAAPSLNSKEEKKSKRSQPAAMFPCFSLPAVCCVCARHSHSQTQTRVKQHDQVGTVSTALTMLYYKHGTFDRLLFCWGHFQLWRKRIEGRWGLLWMLSKMKNSKMQNKRKMQKKG